jgi:hypothetical protein
MAADPLFPFLLVPYFGFKSVTIRSQQSKKGLHTACNPFILLGSGARI